jgi:hypothetical protein
LPSTADWALLAVPLAGFATGVYQRFGNLIRASMWSDLCECAPASGIGCTSRTFPLTYLAANPTGSACGNNSWYLGFSNNENFFPAGQHHFQLRILGITTNHDVQFDPYTIGNGERCFTWLAGTQFVINYDGQPTDTRWDMAFRDGGNRPSFIENATCQIDYSNLSSEPPCANVGTAVPPPVVPPAPTGFPNPPSLSCATIPDICAALTQLNNKLDILRMEAQLLQRWGKPFGYVGGAQHTDLVDAGSIQVDRLLGISVYVTTPPPGAPVLPGNPPYLWDCGWMSINDSNGMLEEKRVTRSGFDWFPRDMPLATSFNWALTPGTVITVIEQRPEP